MPTPGSLYVSPFYGTPAPGSNTVHIDPDYWTSEGEPGSGAPVAGKLSIVLSGLTVHDCPTASCSFTTQTPSPELPITIRAQ